VSLLSIIFFGNNGSLLFKFFWPFTTHSLSHHSFDQNSLFIDIYSSSRPMATYGNGAETLNNRRFNPDAPAFQPRGVGFSVLFKSTHFYCLVLSGSTTTAKPINHSLWWSVLRLHAGLFFNTTLGAITFDISIRLLNV
jgi:hypothetical protein